jgi:hypothetical protein
MPFLEENALGALVVLPADLPNQRLDRLQPSNRGADLLGSVIDARLPDDHGSQGAAGAPAAWDRGCQWINPPLGTVNVWPQGNSLHQAEVL